MKKNKPNHLLEAVAGLLSELPRGRVLDLGCGKGDYAKRLKDLGFDAVASDMDAKRFKHADQVKFQESHLERALPFPDRHFHYVLFLEVIEHLYNPDFVIAQISRVLAPGGHLVISTPNILNLGSRMRFLFDGGYDFFREPILDYCRVFPGGLQNMHVIPWRYQELEYLLHKNGLRVRSIHTDLMKPSLRFFWFVFGPLFKGQSWLRERRVAEKGGVDSRRMTKILFSKELLFGRHLIVLAKKA